MNMKLKTLLCVGVLLLCSCSGKNKNSSEDTSSQVIDTSVLKIVCPTGAPAVAFYNQAENPNFETNSTPSNIVAMMNESSNKDIVVIDTVSGIRAINSGAPYKMAANITLGNFYIASTGNDKDGVMSPGDKIVLFGQNQTPDKIFHYLYENIYNETIQYVTNVQDASKCLASGKNLVTQQDVDYVFIAQPALFATINNKDSTTYGRSSVYVNIQEEYKKKSNNLSLIQASVFVKNTSDKTIVDSFLSNLEKDINDCLENPSLITEGMGKISSEESLALYGINSNVAKKVVEDNNSLGLGYVNAYSNKQAIDSFINLFEVSATNEEIYYKQ